jgi:hypothetical protein
VSVSAPFASTTMQQHKSILLTLGHPPDHLLLLVDSLPVLRKHASQHQDPGGSVRRLGTGSNPVLCSIKVQLDVLHRQHASLELLVRPGGRNGVVCANHLDGQTVSSLAGLGHHNVVQGRVSSAKSRQSNSDSSLHDEMISVGGFFHGASGDTILHAILHHVRVRAS